ncbi:MAG: helicase HerA-like domain-containing protein [Acidimicrobiales bacterium]
MADATVPSDFAARITRGYAAEGAVVGLGRGVLDGTTHPDAVVQIPAAMCNRHGLIAGATGTGKTVTLQVMAEQLSAIGVPVFAADMKGDLSGIAHPAEPNDRLTGRATELGIEWTPNGSPTAFLSLGGVGPGVPVRAPVSAFGPELLAKVLGANETQRSSLALVFRYADEHGLPLLDLADLRTVLHYLTGDEGKADLKAIGGVSSATAGVLLRSISELEGQGGDAFFGEPEFAVPDLLRLQGERGVISCLELPAVQDRPRLFSTFLMWLLASLFETLPEVGDLDQPKLVFFFDEAHLLFADASDEFLDQVAQTVRLIRSKGIGVFFVTQLPDDVPDVVLAQLGSRIQHALRAHTPRDAKALKAAVSTYPTTEDYDLEKALTELGTGEAIVTILSEKGAPTPVVWTKMLPPSSFLGALDPATVKAAGEASPLWPTYAVEIDRESATELLAAKMGVPSPTATAPATTKPKKAGKAVPKKTKGHDVADTSAVTDYLKSREGRSMLNTIARGVFSMLKKS